jgi:chemotaxis protein CheX
VNTTSDVRMDDLNQEQWPELLELSTKEVFQIMLSSALEDVNGEAESVPLECTAMVGLAGHLCGVLTFRCSPQSAAIIASKMLGIEIKNCDEQSLDAIGEVSNMVAGNFKNKISGLSESCVLSAPTVVVGGDYRVHSLVAQSLQKTFKFEGESVSVALELRV